MLCFAVVQLCCVVMCSCAVQCEIRICVFMSQLLLPQHSNTPTPLPAPPSQARASPPSPPPTPQLVRLFGSVRDEWIATDLAGWLAPNRIYPGVADAMHAAVARGDEVYIVTTKQVRTEVAEQCLARHKLGSLVDWELEGSLVDGLCASGN